MVQIPLMMGVGQRSYGTWRQSALVASLPLLLLMAVAALAVPAELMVSAGEKQAPLASVLERALQPRSLVFFTSDAPQNHSSFVESLRNSGHQLTLKQFDGSSDFPDLLRFGEPLYDNLVLITSEDKVASSKSGPKPKFILDAVNRTIDFIEKHSGNLMILGRDQPPANGGKAAALGLAARLLQRFAATTESSILPVQDFVENFAASSSIVKGVPAPTTEGIFSSQFLNSPVAYEGVAHLLSDQNLLPFPLLHGSPTTYTETPSSGRIVSSGSSLALVFALQTRTNSRIIVSGSSTLCSDEMTNLNPSNLRFCQEITDWNSHRKGVVDWSKIYHRRVDSATTDSMYRINDDIEFQVDLHQLKGSIWLPFNQSSDLQIEYTMLDPYWRLFLKNAKKEQIVDTLVTSKSYLTGASPKSDSTVALAFKCPDRYGIFKFVFRLTRKGLTFIHLETLAPLRNFKHNDYERFIWAAFPYYASTFAALVLVVTFCILFMRMPPKLKRS